VRHFVDGRPGFRVQLDRVTVLERPEWLADSDLEALRKAAGLDGSRGYFDPELPEAVREAWGRSPLLAAAPRVSRIHPNRVRVSLTVRRPVAAVHDFGAAARPLVLVDREGVRWPGRFHEVPERFGELPVITGLDPARRTPAAGSNAWGDSRVTHGVAVAVDLARNVPEDLAGRLDIRRIDVSGVGRDEPMRPEISLETGGGVVIEWGRSSISSHARRELPLARKIAHLAEACRSPGLDRVSVLRVQYDTLGFVER